ncbi:Aste57867_22945 [Aphanomyces stellatus]|uniref:ubiquitinyl hydrolase 1 n=1 Tax=Aphanomyces stellatus TaxID=120398 RepID=A0A485LLJ3_9STRA|nr:hypothetical protein As57867_022874 [Aphanomyces stellatus]VFT99595.1 Aste57867_22945 [Aphanomyces stellatus]
MDQTTILFGDFTLEETQKALASSAQATQPRLPPTPPSPPKPFSWGNLAKPQPQHTSRPNKSTSATDATESLETAFEPALLQLNLRECARDLMRRGFLNQGNTCFQNVTLQALLACPPFRNLLATLSSHVALPPSLSPPPLTTWIELIRLVRELEEPALSSAATVRQSASKAPIVLTNHFLRLFHSANGTQQDALEFLEFLLDHLHTEFEASPCRFPLAPSVSAAELNDDGWAQMKKGGKASVVHHNIVENDSPITYLFKGTLRSEVQSGRKFGASTIEPFHCLHLTMGSTTPTLLEMIRATMADEVLAPNTTKRTTFETLPVVLSLHIKRFTYDPVKGPIKLTAFVSYPLELELPQALFSPALKTKAAKYKLFSVISHHGLFAVGGHYTALCCDAKDQWSLYDDDNVINVTKQAALEEDAYLLFYIRVNP